MKLFIRNRQPVMLLASVLLCMSLSFSACTPEEELLACAIDAIFLDTDLSLEDCISEFEELTGQRLAFSNSESSIEFFNIKIVESSEQVIGTASDQVTVEFIFKGTFLSVSSGALIISNIDSENGTFDVQASAQAFHEGEDKPISITAKNVSFTE